MSIVLTEKHWWKPLSKDEKWWLKIAIVVGIFLFLMMPIYHLFGKQNQSEETYRVSAIQFLKLTEDFIKDNAVLDEQGKQVMQMGIPVVSPKDGVKDIFLLARMWQFYPILKLQKGREYRMHLASGDLNHGFSLQPQNINFQIVPGYDQVVTFTPRESGEFHIICNEYCLIGHHTMIGKLIVE